MFLVISLIAFYCLLRIGEITGPNNTENNSYLYDNQISIENVKANIKFMLQDVH